MALFDISLSKCLSVSHATDILSNIRAAYAAAKLVNDLMAMYQANGSSDAAFHAAVNAIFTTAERQELAAVAAHFAALVSELEANHAAAIGNAVLV